MRSVHTLLCMTGILCLLTGTGCSNKGSDGGGDGTPPSDTGGDGGLDSDTSPGPGEGESDLDAGLGTDTAAGDTESDTFVSWPDGGPPVLDPENCELGYAPEALASFETSGAMAGVYNFFYDDAGNLVHFMADVSAYIEFEFEYENNQLIKTTRTTDDSEVYEATYEYDDAGLPTTVYGRNRSTEEEGWLYSMIELFYEEGRLSRKISWICEAEGECQEATIDMQYYYDNRGLLVQTEYTRDGLVSRWELTYDDEGNLLSNLQTLADGEAIHRGDIYSYEDNWLVWREVYVGGEMLSSRGYYYEDGRLSISKDPETGRYTQFDWTADATACSLLRAWHLPFLHFELGSSSQEMLLRLYGRGGPTGMFY